MFASDLHERSLRHAREGLYPEAIAEDVPPARLERFFLREDSTYRVRKELRDVVVFASHNLLQDPPFSRLDLIVCRNVLIYLQSDAQRDVVELFQYALQGPGYLLLGTAETLDRPELFRLEHRESHLYRRRDVPRGELRLPAFSGSASVPMPGPSVVTGAMRPSRPPAAAPSYGAIHQTMLERYAPPSLLVDADDNVVHLSENAGRYLQHPGGVPTTNVFRLVRDELRVELRAALHGARESPRPRRSRPVPVAIDGEPRQVTLQARPTSEPDLDGFTIVLFDEVDEPAAAGSAVVTPDTMSDAALR